MNVDKLTYAGNLDLVDRRRVASATFSSARTFATRYPCARVLDQYQPIAIFHLAAESHVDRSIDAPTDFVQTNIVGTSVLLTESRRYWKSLSPERASAFGSCMLSTDEVYGSSATRASSRKRPRTTPAPRIPQAGQCGPSGTRLHRTYGFPAIVTNCSNNYGPHQFPEKLIPLTILNAIAEKPIGVYGRGENVRDWLYVDDHADALISIMARGRIGDTYAISGRTERRNIDVVESICSVLDELRPRADGARYRELIRFVADRPGHDLRYAIDAAKIERELSWRPSESFESGLRKTVEWYLDNTAWLDRVRNGSYRGERLGLGATV